MAVLGAGWLRPSPAKLWAHEAVAVTSAASRLSVWYGPGRAPDSVDGRFEVLTLHATAALLRLKGEVAAQRLADAYANRLFRSLDEGLRELGVGDFSIPRAMRGLAGRVYGRVRAYEAALGDPPALAAAVARNVFNADEAAFAPTLAARLQACAAALAAAPVEAIADAATWPAAQAA